MAWVVTAVTTAIEIGTVAAVATAVAEVGLAMTVVGTVTKSKELTSIGKVLSVAGGVTSLAANLANLGTTAATSAAGGAATAEGAASSALGEASKAAMTNQAAEAGTTALANEVTGAGIAELAPNLAQNATYGIEGLSGLEEAGASALGDVSTGGLVNQAAGQSMGGFGLAPITGEEAIQAAATPQFATDVAASTNAAAQAINPSAVKQTQSWWDKQTPQVKSALIQGGLGAVGGLSQAWSNEQRMALDQKIAEERIKESQALRSNASAIPTIRFQPVGLVNRAIGGR